MFIIIDIVELDVKLEIGCAGPFQVEASEVGEELQRAAEGKNGAK